MPEPSAAAPTADLAQPGRPILTLAIPTYNRSAALARLLDAITPELAQLPQVELLISDNASPDDTETMLARRQQQGLRCTYLRNATNLDADPNFLQCYQRARGRYVWIFGDDDVIFPGTLTLLARILSHETADLIYMAPFGFTAQPNERGHANPAPAMGVFSNPAAFLHAVGLRGDLVLISSLIIHKDTVERAPHPDFADGFRTQLLQMGWTFTALHRMQRGLVFERGLYAVCEDHPQRLFNLAGVFGANWARSAATYLGANTALYRTALNEQLYAWFVTNWYGGRRRAHHTDLSNPVGQMLPFYRRLPLFWLCVYPLLTWPMPLAGAWLALWRGLRHVDRWLSRRHFTATSGS